MFDPTEDCLEPSIIGYRLSQHGLKPVKPIGGRIPSKELGITLERRGTQLILCDRQTGKELLLPHQAEAEEVRRQLRKAERERNRAEAARKTALTTQQETETRLGLVEAELARLRQEIEAIRKQRPSRSA